MLLKEIMFDEEKNMFILDGETLSNIKKLNGKKIIRGDPSSLTSKIEELARKELPSANLYWKKEEYPRKIIVQYYRKKFD